MNGVQSDTSKLKSDYESLSKELRTVKERLQTSESVVENQKRELANIRAESANRKRELQDVSLSLRKSQLSNAEYISKLRQLRECQSPRVDEKVSSFLRSKIDELRTRNMDGCSTPFRRLRRRRKTFWEQLREITRRS